MGWIFWVMLPKVSAAQDQEIEGVGAEYQPIWGAEYQPICYLLSKLYFVHNFSS
jgi:hypothetical protein